MLEHRNAVIFGSSVGGAVARAFAREVGQSVSRRSDHREDENGAFALVPVVDRPIGDREIR